MEGAACLVHQRHIQDCVTLPLAFAGAIDERRPLADRFLIAEACNNRAEECRDDWFMPRFLELFPSVEALMSLPVHRWLCQWTWSVQATFAQLEFMHGRN